METFQKILEQIKQIFDIQVFTSGNLSITLWNLLYVFVFLTLLFYLSGKLRNWIVERLLVKTRMDYGNRQAIGSIFRYIVIAIGFLIILQSAGIDLSTVTILVGALGVGIGFGLQNITNNFVSGLIILFERPIKVGDRIEVGEISGDVIKISPRATTVLTNDNIAIIVPNSEFISSTVINWSYTNQDVRFNFPVGVSYGSNPEEVRRLLLEVAEENSGVLKNPAPDVLLQEFGDSSLNFILRVWTREHTTRPGVLRSELNYAISKKFKEHGIEIPFPQRDIHIRSGIIELKTPVESSS